MQEIKCPRCGELFQIDETGYAEIVRQVRDAEFQKELERREQELDLRRQSDLRLAAAEQEKVRAEALSAKEAEISKQKQEITALQAKLAAGETEKQLAIREAVSAKEQELAERTTEITQLRGQLQSKETERQLGEKSLQEQYEARLKMKDEQIEYYKDFKARQSTKMIGESLEQHCLNQFNALRMTAFPHAYFEKDNDAASGSKGDFIFRESAEDGTEFISIMFEMKNEADETRTKHKNEDFFKELDKDRREKGCEYAVLVSLLEGDNEYYNAGIVDVSYRYPKMYVVRPQFFIPMITLLRNAALNSLQYQQELQVVRNQQLDILHFEENMNAFKAGFARNYELASRKFGDAIAEIDKSIAQLQKVKEALTSSERNLRLANDKAQDLSIKKLTKNSPSLKVMFDEVRQQTADNEE
ncbi:MAG: DUF2130 domain-containing protein [Ruminococcaceae bacterium]|nr:DUF2130 domain-containing protein [Oscillospiraceae bacterium]